MRTALFLLLASALSLTAAPSPGPEVLSYNVLRSQIEGGRSVIVYVGTQTSDPNAVYVETFPGEPKGSIFHCYRDETGTPKYVPYIPKIVCDGNRCYRR